MVVCKMAAVGCAKDQRKQQCKKTLENVTKLENPCRKNEIHQSCFRNTSERRSTNCEVSKTNRLQRLTGSWKGASAGFSKPSVPTFRWRTDKLPAEQSSAPLSKGGSTGQSSRCCRQDGGRLIGAGGVLRPSPCEVDWACSDKMGLGCGLDGPSSSPSRTTVEVCASLSPQHLYKRGRRASNGGVDERGIPDTPIDPHTCLPLPFPKIPSPGTPPKTFVTDDGGSSESHSSASSSPSIWSVSSPLSYTSSAPSPTGSSSSVPSPVSSPSSVPSPAGSPSTSSVPSPAGFTSSVPFSSSCSSPVFSRSSYPSSVPSPASSPSSAPSPASSTPSVLSLAACLSSLCGGGDGKPSTAHSVSGSGNSSVQWSATCSSIASPSSAPTSAVSSSASALPEESDVVCQWEACGNAVKPEHLLEHLRVEHVDSQKDGEKFMCQWESCKVAGKASCSMSWLERHVVTHGGHKPFRCILPHCGARFPSQLALQRHVNAHFATQQQSGNGRSHRCRTEEPSGRSARRKNKTKRQRPQCARSRDFFDIGIMDQLRRQLLDLTEKTRMGVNGGAHHVTFQGAVKARRIDENRKESMLLDWTPEEVLEESWQPTSQVDSLWQRNLPLAQLSSLSTTNVHPSLYRRHRFRKHRRK